LKVVTIHPKTLLSPDKTVYVHIQHFTCPCFRLLLHGFGGTDLVSMPQIAGVVDFSPGAGIWFAHGHVPEVQALYVDRVVLIME
jgi:hypothetical protein